MTCRQILKSSGALLGIETALVSGLAAPWACLSGRQCTPEVQLQALLAGLWPSPTIQKEVALKILSCTFSEAGGSSEIDLVA